MHGKFVRLVAGALASAALVSSLATSCSGGRRATADSQAFGISAMVTSSPVAQTEQIVNQEFDGCLTAAGIPVPTKDGVETWGTSIGTCMHQKLPGINGTAFQACALKQLAATASPTESPVALPTSTAAAESLTLGQMARIAELLKGLFGTTGTAERQTVEEKVVTGCVPPQVAASAAASSSGTATPHTTTTEG